MRIWSLFCSSFWAEESSRSALREIRHNKPPVCSGFFKIWVDARRNHIILHHRRQNGWMTKSIYTFTSLPKHLKHHKGPCMCDIRDRRKCWNLPCCCVCVCMCVCVCVVCVCVVCVCMCVWCMCVCGVCVCVCVCVCISSIQINFLRNTAAVNWTLCCQMFGLLSYIKQELFRIQNVNLGVPPWKRNGCPTQVYPNRRFSTKVSPLYWKTAHDNQKLKETKAGNRRWQLTEQSLTIALTQNTVDAHRLIVQLVLRVLRTKGYVILQQVRRLYLWQCKTNLSFRFRFIAMDSTDSKNMLFAFTAIMWNCSQQSYETVHSNHVKLFLR